MRVGLGLALALLAGGAAAQEEKGFRDWLAVCSNRLDCTAMTFEGTEVGAYGGYLKLDRPLSGPAKVALNLFDEAIESEDKGTMTVVLRGPRPLTLTLPAVAHDTASYWTARPSTADTAKLMAALKDATSLEVSVGQRRARLSTTGSAASLLWLDERQGRLGKPVKPPAQGPAKRAAAAAQTNLPKALPTALNARDDVKACMEDSDLGSDYEPIVTRLAAGKLLYGVPCGAGAYNFGYLMLVADEQGQKAELAPLLTYEPQLDPVLINPDYDPDTRTLRAFNKGRGLGDCGQSREWVWDGAAFQLIGAAEMSECKGVPPDDWPVFYTRAAAP